jgi:signal transduction histidine kinase
LKRSLYSSFHSIRWRLIFSYVFLTILTVSVVGFVAMEIERRSAYQRELGEMQASADAIAHQANRVLSPTVRPYELTQLVRATAFLGNMRVRILDRQHNLVADSGLPGEWNDMVWIAPPEGAQLISPDLSSSGLMVPLEHPKQPDVRSSYSNLPPGTLMTVIRKTYGPWGGRISFEALTSASAQGQNIVPIKERSDVSVTVPVGADENLKGYVELSAGPNYGAETLATTQQAFLFAGVGTTLLAVLIGLFMGNRLAMPLRHLSSTASQMGEGNLAVRSSIHSQDEIGDLAGRLNQMAERLQTSFKQLEAERDALRRFIQDASHELRTPITALKNFNDLLLGPASGDAEVLTEFLTESQVQIDRLQWITQNLLNLSRIDAGLVQLECEDNDAGDLLMSASVPFKPLAADKGMQLIVNLPDPPLSVKCDSARMVLVLSNLVDNAIKYTAIGGQVEMSASQVGEKVQFWVQDYGPGISEEDLPHIFERFYRGRNATGPGSGLGLSIVASLVQAHGGKVWAESEPGRGTKFIVEL